LFKKGSFKGDRNGCIVCCGTVTQCTIDECEFIENKFNVGSAAVLITTPTCIQMIIKGTASKRTTISGLGTKNPIKGNFIKTVSSKISISYTDFIDSTFSGLGNAVKIDDQQASEISLIWCNFTKLGTNSGGQLSSCIHSMLSSENGFLFNAEYCIFSDCRYSGLSQVSGNAITIQSQSSDRSAVRQVKFSECIITNNRGNGYCGAVLIDSLTKCTINFIGSFFNENNGTEVNDIWIRSTNSLSELNISNFNTSFSDCLQPHIVTINDQLESTYNLNHFPGVIFVSNKIIIETRDGSRDKPNQRILDSFPKLDYQTKPIQMPRTIYVIEEIWDEYLYGVSFTNPLVIKSGLADDSNGIKRKVTWITTSSSNVIIYYNKGDLTLENIQFNFTNVSNSFRPFHEHIWIVTSGSNNSSFTAISCIFNGLGIYGQIFHYLIGAYNLKFMVVKDFWKLVEIKSIQGLETQMRRSSGDINGAIITLTLDSITPSTVQYVIMIVDYGFFVIQQSNKEQLTLSNIEFIGAGTVKQEGLALLSIEYSSFKLSNNMSTILSFVQAIRGQLEINSCSFGTSLETQLGSPAIQTSSQCTNIKFTQAIFYNLHSIITNGEQKASGAVIEMGEKTEVEFTDCTFIHCIDSSSDIQHSTGAVCIILKSSDSLIHQLSDEQTIQSTISFNQCQFTGCIGGSSGAIQSISNQSLLNLRLNIIIDKCSFNNCGNNYSIVGACWFNGESVNNNYGEASITNNQFRNCIGIKAGGILFGENMQPINARNNTFSNISIELTKCLVTIDIFFSSKEFLDQAGGIVQVAQGYKYEQNQQQNTIGEIKIKGFSSNFAPYLDCVSRNEEEQCGQIPCGGELNLKPEQCEYIEDEDNDQECKQKCVPSLNTPISECGCLPENDPRIACKQVCIPTKDSLINELCPCFLIGDPREACKTISIPTEDTPVTVDNPCLAHNDPREACKTISVPTEDTPVTVDNPCLAYNDPREACKTISIPTPDTPVTVDNPCLAHNDPREACKTISIPTEDTPVTVDNPCLAYNDPRDVCQKACIPLADTPINVCGCLEINDPRSQCQKSCVPKANTPINECCCFDIDDPRDECKGKTQSGLDDEKQQDQSEIDNPKQQQEEAKKEGLSSGFIALIVIS
ncbi:MAG: hypothetical protein EZS28_027105, partial [Streblomastix strix]